MPATQEQLDVISRAISEIEERMDNQVSPREFGQLEGAVTSLSARVDALAKDVEVLSKEVRRLTDVMSEAKGGWRAVAWVAGFAGTVGAGVAWAISHVRLAP